MKSSQVPVARKEGLVVQETSEEVLVYDLNSNKAHCLNQTAAFVWKSCDGNNSVGDITKLFENETGSAVPEDMIWLAIDQLKDKELLQTVPADGLKGRSRRDVIKTIGLATVVALPIVASLTAPTSVMAAVSCSCLVPGDCVATACPSTVNCNASNICAP
ncbi:MAG: PqqD family protein [Acidobacteria bacterium]|nr:PqqD family protein [Acidobacteriota bacterium]